jgi:hypothetical protein
MALWMEQWGFQKLYEIAFMDSLQYSPSDYLKLRNRGLLQGRKSIE